MPSRAARDAYTRWLVLDSRYGEERQLNLSTPAVGEEKERRENQLAALAKAVKDAKDTYEKIFRSAMDDTAGLF